MPLIAADCNHTFGRYAVEPTIGLPEFFEIWGGSPRLQLPGVWFYWANTAMLLAAWRKVGFAGGRINSSLIDRTHFIDRMAIGSPSSATRASTKKVDEVVRTPDGMRRGSLAAMTAKFEAVAAHARALETVVSEGYVDPQTVPFLMAPKELDPAKKRDRSQADMSLYEGGSASLRNVRKTVDAKRAAIEEKAAAVEARKEERAGKQSDAVAAAAQLIADFELCAQACACGQSPCPMEGMKACGSCRAAGRLWLKPRVCVVRECVAARKGPARLALTLVGAPTPGAPTPIARLTYDGAQSEEEDIAADEVMPAAKPRAAEGATLCDWACDHPEMTTEEVELGYCSGRRCKAKMHPACFLRHTGEAGAALGDLTCFCRACWAAQ